MYYAQEIGFMPTPHKSQTKPNASPLDLLHLACVAASNEYELLLESYDATTITAARACRATADMWTRRSKVYVAEYLEATRIMDRPPANLPR